MRTQNPLVATPCGFKSHRRHHVGMDCAPFEKPSRKAGLFSYRSVIPPSPRETLLRKFSQGPWPPCRAANVQAVYRLRRLFCKSHRRAHSAAPRFPALPGDNALRSIQKARPPGRAFFVYRKPLARRVVQKKTNVDNGKRKTPFAILGVRSANCTSKQREVIQK